MFCSKCGTKNESNAKFCEKCGNKLEEEKKEARTKSKTKSKSNEFKDKFKKIPKKVKISILIAIVIIVVAIIALVILLSNPVKKVEDYLTSYHDNYTSNYGNKELVEIGDILVKYKGNEDKLESISKQINNTINNWVKNFNKSYKDADELEEAYDKLYGILSEINKYFDGLEYVLTDEDYNDYLYEITYLYRSKRSYFYGINASSDLSKYNYFAEVIADDSYYKEAQEFIDNYLKEELDDLKSSADELVTLSDNATNEEILEAYISQIEFLEDNKYSNSIDLSGTQTYQELYNNAASKIVEYTKKVAEELDTNLETNEVMNLIEESMDALDYNSDEYAELEELKTSYEDKLPDSLISKYLVSSTWGTNHSSYGTTIDDQEYDSYVSFSFEGETVSRVYRLNNEYKTLKTTIVRGPNWDSDFTGEIVIYGDDKELYRSGEITKTNEINAEINLDITGVDDLKIEFVTTSEPDGWTSFYIYLVEPYLYK